MIWAQILVSGSVIGCVYALVGLGLVLIHSGTRVVHFGYGDQMMASTYLVIILERFAGLPFPLAVVLSLAASALGGLMIHASIMAPLASSPVLVQIIATLALGSGLREGVRAFMGSEPWPFPFLLPLEPWMVGDLALVPGNLAVAGIAVLAMLALAAFFAWSRPGRGILAVYANRVGAAIVGIPVPVMLAGVWMMASVLAAVAGMLVAPLVTLTPDMGVLSIKGFTAAVIGGFHSLPGAVVGGILLGIIETAAGYYVSSAAKDIIAFVLLIVTIAAWPEGLLTRRIAKKV